MTNVTNELIFEVLKDIQMRIGRIEDAVNETKTEIRAVRGHMNAIQLDIGNLYTITAQHDVRFDRIEKRLGLNELTH